MGPGPGLKSNRVCLTESLLWIIKRMVTREIMYRMDLARSRIVGNFFFLSLIFWNKIRNDFLIIFLLILEKRKRKENVNELNFEMDLEIVREVF